MIVTELSELSKDKVKVYIDNEFAFVLYKGELRNYHIREGEPVSETDYYTIKNEVLTKRAKLRCMNLLKSRDYTKYQLLTKLKQGLYPDEIIDIAIEYCESYHYIDDVRYARAYIGYAENSKNRKQIELELQKKGISKQDIDTAYYDKEEEDGLVEEEELILKFLNKKHFSIEDSSYEERQKIIAALYRKGFSLDKIYKVIDNNA